MVLKILMFRNSHYGEQSGNKSEFKWHSNPHSTGRLTAPVICGVIDTYGFDGMDIDLEGGFSIFKGRG